MSLDVYLTAVRPTTVHDGNITHNLGKMADAVKLSDDLTLYHVLWRPDEHGLVYAADIVDYLFKGLEILKRDPKKFRQYNPKNGWGSYEGLVEFVRKYLDACLENPDAEIGVCR